MIQQIVVSFNKLETLDTPKNLHITSDLNNALQIFRQNCKQISQHIYSLISTFIVILLPR